MQAVIRLYWDTRHASCRQRDAMKQKQMLSASEILRMRGTRHHLAYGLVTWHPRGVYDDELADRIIEFMESKERILGEPFNRFTDLTGLERVDLSLEHVFKCAERRRKGYRGAKVKSAFFAVRMLPFSIARIYQELMEGSSIDVCVFRDRAEAAAWLGVPVGILNPPAVK